MHDERPAYLESGDTHKLSYKKAFIGALDRPGGRFLLGKIATSVVRQAGGDGVEIKYVDGMWTRRTGGHIFPDGLTFEYSYADFDGWKRQAEIYASDTKEYWLRHYRPQEGDTIIDVGAGRGEDTLTFSRAVGKTGRVIAIEAHPVTFAILESFCRLNRLDNVTPLHLALMDKEGTVRIAESESSWMENAIANGNETRGVTVRADTFDDICKTQGLGSISFLKMNIEGAERQALLGMKPVLRDIRQICVACHDFRADRGHGEHFRTRVFVERFLAEQEFTLAARRDDSRDWVRDHIFGLRHA